MIGRVAFLAAFLAGSACDGDPAAGASERSVAPDLSGPDLVFGARVKIEIDGFDGDKADLAIEAAMREIRRIDDALTGTRPSDLTRLNDAAGKGPQEVRKELADILDLAITIGKLSGGAFDVTHPAVYRLWGFDGQSPSVPDAESIHEALQNMGSARIEVDLDRSTVELPAGVSINLRGLARGYAVDRAMTVLQKLGVRNATVRIGENRKLLGQDGGRPWKVSIVHPRDPGRTIATLRLTNTCVVTASTDERFFEREGVRYHHILDPRTGFPSKGCISATVVAPNAEFADALTTTLCVLEPREGMRIVSENSHVEAILVGTDGEIYASRGLRPFLK